MRRREILLALAVTALMGTAACGDAADRAAGDTTVDAQSGAAVPALDTSGAGAGATSTMPLPGDTTTGPTGATGTADTLGVSGTPAGGLGTPGGTTTPP